jgi:AraC-like DNA-binding protein
MIKKLKKQHWFRNSGVSLAVERRDPQEPFGLHSHEFYELVIITGGTGLHVTGQDSWVLSAGDVFLIEKDRPHDYQNMHDLRLINILFDMDNVPLQSFDLANSPGFHVLFSLEPAWRQKHNFQSRLHLSENGIATVLDQITALEEELIQCKTGFGIMATALFMQLIIYLSRCHEESKNPSAQSLLRIATAISFLEKNLTDEISLDHLADVANMSKRNLIRSFHAAVGLSPISYLIQLRIKRAAILLRTSNAAITEIASNVGFNDSNYFTRQFSKVTGTSPRLYRKINNYAGLQLPTSS